MKEEDLSQLTDEMLLLEQKKIKSTNIVHAVLFGVMIGVATYSTVKNGFGILTFFPFFFIPMLTKNRTKKKALEEEVKKRNLTL